MLWKRKVKYTDWFNKTGIHANALDSSFAIKQKRKLSIEISTV